MVEEMDQRGRYLLIFGMYSKLPDAGMQRISGLGFFYELVWVVLRHVKSTGLTMRGVTVENGEFPGRHVLLVLVRDIPRYLGSTKEVLILLH